MSKPRRSAKAERLRLRPRGPMVPGCGGYAIIQGVHRTLAELQIPLEKLVFFSGIGTQPSSPYYMASYGFHTIHGRARRTLPPVTTRANPDLDIWVVMGDGDALSIGGNHTMHAPSAVT